MKYDELFHICLHCDPPTLLRLLSCSKHIRDSFQHEHFWKRYCTARWPDIWSLAQRRPVSASKPYITMYHEFLRIAEFEKIATNVLSARPDVHFYKMVWYEMDKLNV